MAKKLTIVSSTSDLATIPSGLGVHGRSLWRRVMKDYNITDCGGLELLYQACAGADRAEDSAAAVARDGSIIQTKSGPRGHPLIREEMNARAFVVRTLQKLGVTLEPLRPMGRPPSPVSVTFRGG